jgi:DNA (cytosine-5)-methyltransferase 1
MTFKYVDLFAGIGGFHAALSALGGECVYASEIDAAAAKVYELNWGLKPDGDITEAANDEHVKVPAHDVLVGGFPCQPFSKSGLQRGMEETRGTLFWNIAKIIEKKKPSIVLLENVRNLAGPRHRHEWEVIIKTLRELGYRVSETPSIVSPHRLNPDFGGRPQIRERVFIAATRIPTGKFNDVEVEIPDLSFATEGWDSNLWNLSKDLPLTRDTKDILAKYALTDEEVEWVDVWDEFVQQFKAHNKGAKLPGFPIWADFWEPIDGMEIPRGTPDWKINFLTKNAELYTTNKKWIDSWLKKHNNLEHFPPSRRKLEWQAQHLTSLWQTVMHFRPSGIRAKVPNYVPAMVAIAQTSIIGSSKRRITPLEGARLQGLPDSFSFGEQSDSPTYKQLGNGVNVGAVYNVMKAVVIRDQDLLAKKPELVKAILKAPKNPDERLAKLL